jgi:hypothetical protein
MIIISTVTKASTRSNLAPLRKKDVQYSVDDRWLERVERLVGDFATFAIRHSSGGQTFDPDMYFR